ncbi:hypothetical protein Acy02nite_15290 [Actinoplanes cyaneus]|uniref:Uncharacterized protein n=1 Tax=Actinoplanes cyaneus TaxID=52696 RepID=A0A919IDN2_9ACTN|nr:hypothetical protein [Actinoplanes cyaneus]MCW2142194.1 hypothetical protein [Actinoplanes cyaneus]GID63648.1 hypothetical protein Acy02nite_15290 [Actinoplanes cyaneus]
MQIIRHKTVKAALGLPLVFAVTGGAGAAAVTADLALSHRAAAAATRSADHGGSTRSATRGGSTWTPTRNTALAQLMADAVAPSLAAGETDGRATFPGASRLLVTTGEPVPGRLKAALLTVGDLPKGYVAMPDALKAFSDTGSQIGACDKKRPQPAGAVTTPDRPVAPGAPEGPGLPVRPSPRIAVSPSGEPNPAPGQPGATSGQPGATSGQPGAVAGQPGAASGKPDPTVATPVAPPPGQPGSAPGKPGKPAKPGDKKDGDTVRVAFMKGETGPVLIEAINPAGDRAAQAVVDAVADAPRRCPTYDEGKPGTPDALHMATYPLQVPKFGNRTAGVRFEVDLNSPRVTVHGKMIAVSVRGVALTVLLANLEQPDQRELEAITRTAVQKLERQK